MTILSLKNFYCHAINNFSLQLNIGQCVGLTGPSGVGKSQLLRAIADLIPHTGELLLKGQSYSDYTPSQWRQQVGLLPATSAWWYATVAEHFTNSDDTLAFSQLEALGLDRKILDQPVHLLSSGEQQRLALLRLLQNRPLVLLLDEPTAHLDAKSQQQMQTFLLDYLQQYSTACLWVSHDQTQLQQVADKVIQL